MATCQRCGLSKWFLSLSDNGLCEACADAELKEATVKSRAQAREIEKPAQTEKLSPDSPSVDTAAHVSSSRRPQPGLRFEDYIGQEEIKQDIWPRIEAAVRHSRPLPHLLLSGPPEMGKATLAHAIAREMKVKINRTYGPKTGEPADFTRLLTELDEKDIFLIEQIESLKEPALETLLEAVDDFTLELVTERESKPRSLPLQRFTLIGTTSKPWDVDKRLRRWMIRFDFAPYSLQEIGEIMKSIGNLTIDPAAATLLAQHCGGTPGNARVMIKRLNDYIKDYATDHVTVDLAREALVSFGYVGKASSAADLVTNLCSMTDTAFEEFIVGLFREQGYRVEVASETSDSGTGLSLRKNNQSIAVQCQRGDAPVGETIVRNFYAALTNSGAQSGYLLTTSTFTSHAYSFAQGKPIQLVDLEALIDLATRRASKSPRSGKQRTR
ncbi:MAG TPA: restriction endonuclease [Candidatus Binatia bacterium]|jgi:Holliday junction DNA helicase RuvB